MQTWIRANIGALKERMTAAENSITSILGRLGGLSLVKLTKSEYEAMESHDPNTLYVVVADPEPTETTAKTTKKRSVKNG
jgi:hypothetical protein